MTAAAVVVSIILGLGVLAGLYLAWTYNRLVRARNLAAEGWSGIDVQLRRRADLVPNLVRTVKGYAAHERELFERLAEWRGRSLGASGPDAQAVAEQGLGAALRQLLAVAEAYPELKADANFRALQGQLAEVEDELQLARRYYNGAARLLNDLVQSFPSNLVAGGFGFGAAAFFELEAEAPRGTPAVDFGVPS
jgi:LemA protein